MFTLMKCWAFCMALLITPLISSAHESVGKFSFEKQSVISFFEKTMSPDACDILRNDTSHKKDGRYKSLMVGFCDSDFDLSKPLVFSQMIQKETKEGKFVCGVVSGTTLYGSKMGARFIVDELGLVLKIKFSKRPIMYATEDSLLRETYVDDMASFNSFYEKSCT